MQDKDKKFIFFLIFMLLGTVTAIQFRSMLFFNKQKALAAYTVDGLKKQIDEQKKVTVALTEEITKMQKKKEDDLKAEAENKNSMYMKSLLESLKDAELKAGLTDVKGPGLIISMDDALLRKNEELRDLIIHDIDIIRVINELKAAGAQTISINGERIIATSEQVCAGPTIRINKNRYAVPYEIKVIGDADALYNIFSKSQIAAYLNDRKIRIEISKSKEVVIPKYISNVDRLRSKLEVAN